MKNSFKQNLFNLYLYILPEIYCEKEIEKFYSRKKMYPIPLAYHNFLYDDKLKDYNVSPDEFESQVKYLVSNGYEFLWEKEYELTNKKSVIISVDDGWDNNYTYMFPILKKYNVKATINLTVGKALLFEDEKGYLSEENIKEMIDSGLVSFEAHSISHPHLSKCSDDEIEYELTESKRVLKEKFDIDSTVFACPHEDVDLNVLQHIKRHFKSAYNFYDGFEHLYSIHRLYVEKGTTSKELSKMIFNAIRHKYKYGYN